MKAILSVGARSLAAVAVRAAGVDLLGVNQGGVEQNADRLGSVELAGEGVQAGQQPVGEADLDRAADRWAAGPALGSIGPKYSSTAEARKFRQSPDASAETVVRVILKVLAAAGEDRWT